MNILTRLILAAAIVVICAGSSGRRSGLVVDYVDRIELNHVLTREGREQFQQVIFWNWDAEVGRYTIVAWRLFKEQHARPFAGYPVYCFYDGRHLRRVVGRHFVETWTVGDPELREREYLPQAMRRGLTVAGLRRDLVPASTTRRNR